MSVSRADNFALPKAACDDVDRRIAQLRDRHWTMLWLSVAIVVAAFLMQTDPHGRVGAMWLSGLRLPELCGCRALFGTTCPGCGLTRSFIALAHGDFAGSFAYHRVGWLLAAAVLLQFPYRIVALRELRCGIVERSWPTWFGRILIAALIGNWLSLMAGLPY